jgi:hypothetical protein
MPRSASEAVRGMPHWAWRCGSSGRSRARTADLLLVSCAPLVAVERHLLPLCDTTRMGRLATRRQWRLVSEVLRTPTRTPVNAPQFACTHLVHGTARKVSQLLAEAATRLQDLCLTALADVAEIGPGGAPTSTEDELIGKHLSLRPRDPRARQSEHTVHPNEHDSRVAFARQ